MNVINRHAIKKGATMGSFQIPSMVNYIDFENRYLVR